MYPNQSYIALLHELADAAGRAILPHFRQTLTMQNKSSRGFDPVTEADRDAERAIRSLICSRFPDHDILGEEFGRDGNSSDYCWVVDPIDGTRAFVQGLPSWGTLIGLTHLGKPVLGVMDQPFTRERFWSDGEATYFRQAEGSSQRITTRHSRLELAQMSTTDPGLFAPGNEENAFLTLRQRVRQCRYGTDCYAYCMLAAGFIDVVIETGLQPYDICALIPIIEQAGGRVTSWDGSSVELGGQVLACGDEDLHAEVTALLRPFTG
ncbi:MAG: histidinol-phosphatase [Hyphomicrobiaceae bacterium]